MLIDHLKIGTNTELGKVAVWYRVESQIISYEQINQFVTMAKDVAALHNLTPTPGGTAVGIDDCGHLIVAMTVDGEYKDVRRRDFGLVVS
jgi:hypothetical protein